MKRGRKPTHPYEPTIGGHKLRILREQARLSQAALATDAGIDTKHLHRIEVGETKHPDYETLDKILSALNARYYDRRDVLWSFGYKMPTSLPTQAEVDDVVRLCIHELNDATIPIYLIDDGQRLLAWNRYLPRLIGMNPDDPALAQFVGVTTIDLAFNPLYKTTFQIDNPDEYLRLLVHTVKTGLQPFEGESWYQELLAHARTLPGFSALWDSTKDSAAQRVAVQHIIPLTVDVPNVGVLQFRLASNPFILDPRFQIIPFIPFGAASLRQCALWAEEEGIV